MTGAFLQSEKFRAFDSRFRREVVPTACKASTTSRTVNSTAFGVNSTWIAITNNMFPNAGGVPQGSKMWVIDKATALAAYGNPSEGDWMYRFLYRYRDEKP